MYYLYDYLDLRPNADMKTINDRYFEYTNIYSDDSSTHEYRKEERRNINRVVAILRDPIKVEMYKNANNLGAATLCTPEIKDKVIGKYLEALKNDLLTSRYSTKWYNHNKEECIISLIEEYVIPNNISESELLNMIEGINTIVYLSLDFAEGLVDESNVKEEVQNESENLEKKEIPSELVFMAIAFFAIIFIIAIINSVS